MVPFPATFSRYNSKKLYRKAIPIDIITPKDLPLLDKNTPNENPNRHIKIAESGKENLFDNSKDALLSFDDACINSPILIVIGEVRTFAILK